MSDRFKSMSHLLVTRALATALLLHTCRAASIAADLDCDGMMVENGVVRCLERSVCFLACDYGFSPVKKHKFDCEEALALKNTVSLISNDPDGEAAAAQDGCAANMAFVVGGQSGKSEYTNTVEIVSVDPALSGREIMSFPYMVESPVALWADGMLMVCGGYNHDESKLEDSCYKYDACQNEWIETTPLDQPRFGAVGVITSDDEPWILGGESSSGQMLTSTWIMRLLAEWVEGPSLNKGKMGHCGASLDGGTLSVITGGETDSYQDTEYFEIIVNSYEQSEDENNLRHKHSRHACSNYIDPNTGEETIVIAGGEDDAGTARREVEMYSLEQGAWWSIASMNEARTGPGMAVLDGRLAVLGGKSGGGAFSAPMASVTVLSADGSAWESLDGVEMAMGRAFAGVVTVPSTLFDGCSSKWEGVGRGEQ